MVILKKLALLIFVLSLESVMGIPLLTLVLLTKYMIEKSSQELFWLISGTFLIGIFYQISFTFTALGIFATVLSYSYSTSIIKSPGARLMVSSFLTSIALVALTPIATTPTLFMNLLVSIVVAGIIVWKFSSLSSSKKKISYEMKSLEYKDYKS